MEWMVVFMFDLSYEDSSLDAFTYLHQAHGFQHAQGLPQGGFANTELDDQFLFGGHPVTRLEAA